MRDVRIVQLIWTQWQYGMLAQTTAPRPTADVNADIASVQAQGYELAKDQPNQNLLVFEKGSAK